MSEYRVNGKAVGCGQVGHRRDAEAVRVEDRITMYPHTFRRTFASLLAKEG